MQKPDRMSRIALLLLVVGAAWLGTSAQAATPPAMPLPPCVNGQGACPDLNPLVTGTASGSLSAGGSVLITTVPTGGVCGSMNGYTYIWTPSGCFAGVYAPTIVNCGYIDLKDMQFKERPCQQALYKTAAPAPLFTMMRPAGNTDYNGSTQCGAHGDYQTFAWGGPYTITESIWQSRGDRALLCELSMAATRPDGLYGPTWAKVRVGIRYGEDGIGRSGRPEYAEFYMPIDGDLRGGVDVSVLATHALSGDADERILTLNLTVENKGEIGADTVDIVFPVPQQLHVLEISDASCTRPDQFVGGTVRCSFALPGKDDPLGRNLRFLDIRTRITNASDLETRMVFTATAANDADLTNNEASTNVQMSLPGGGYGDTLQALKELEAYFNYTTPDSLLDASCDRYMNDIYGRLNKLREQHPAAFRNLSFGRITSGRYGVVGMDAGHVGVVAYAKGTDYHQSGIIIHGTPTWSPTDLDINSQMGTEAMGEHLSINFLGREGTADHGLYYRTRLRDFPGNPKPETPLGCGFEGAYADNADGFTGTVPGACVSQISEPVQSCPFYPDAVLLRTESPVDLHITNMRGQRVQTSGGEITVQELDARIFAYPVPHEDGTFGWTLALPKDQYDIQLAGTGTGPYRLTMRLYDADGKPVDRVIEGDTVPDRVDTFAFDGTVTPPSSGGGGGGGGGSGGSGAGGGGDANGGGGPLDSLLLLALAVLLGVAMQRRRVPAPRTRCTPRVPRLKKAS